MTSKVKLLSKTYLSYYNIYTECMECKSTEIKSNSREGTIVCYNCGLVQQKGCTED